MKIYDNPWSEGWGTWGRLRWGFGQVLVWVFRETVFLALWSLLLSWFNYWIVEILFRSLQSSRTIKRSCTKHFTFFLIFSFLKKGKTALTSKQRWKQKVPKAKNFHIYGAFFIATSTSFPSASFHVFHLVFVSHFIVLNDFDDESEVVNFPFQSSLTALSRKRKHFCQSAVTEKIKICQKSSQK